MNEEHKTIQDWIEKKYSSKFDVHAESISGKNSLPDKSKHLYQPAVCKIVSDETSGPIVSNSLNSFDEFTCKN